MKKILFFLFAFALAALSASAGETKITLHTGEWTCNTSWAGKAEIENSTIPITYAEGDKILVTVSAKNDESEWPQVKIQYSDASWSWQQFDDSDNPIIGLWGVDDYPYTAEFELSADMAAKLNGGKALVVTGCAYTGTKVELVRNVAAPTSYTRDVTIGNYGTVCVPYAVKSPQGGKFYEIAGFTGENTNPTSIVFYEVNELEGGMPYLFRATEDKITLTYSGEECEEDGSNGLVGSFNGCVVNEGMYVIYNNKIQKCGTGCSIGANRAFINITAVPEYSEPSGTRELVIVDIADKTTAISQPSSATISAKGKVLQNGRVVIVNNGQTYNEAGQQIR